MVKIITFKYLNVFNVLHIIHKVIFMVSITLSVPEELKVEMDEHPELNWSEIARQAIREKLTVLKKIDIILAKSTLTEKDAIRIGHKVNKAVAKKIGA